MPDTIQTAYDETQLLAKDYFGLGDSESETLMKLAKVCATTAGVPMAGMGCIALAGVGTVTIPLVGAVPGFVAGALAGFVGGTTACMIARRSSAGHVRQILGRRMSETDFKSAVRLLVSLADGKAGYCRPAV